MVRGEGLQEDGSPKRTLKNRDTEKRREYSNRKGERKIGNHSG